MNTLHLVLEKKWFDMILSGEKKAEYRDHTPYWTSRILNRTHDQVIFHNGYRKGHRTMTVEIRIIYIDRGIPRWGAEGDKTYIVIGLG